MCPHIMIRILDINGIRLAQAETRLRRLLRRHGLPADVEPVACHLEISRQGLAGQSPALQVNGYTVTSARPLDDALLEDCCRRLRHWLHSRHPNS